MRCVAEVGYSQATIRGIAKAADMTSGSLYHHFPNKSELLKATVKEIDEIALPRLRAAAARADGDVVERLEAVLDESDRLMREYPHLAAFDRAMRAESTAHPGAGSAAPRHQPGRGSQCDLCADARPDGAGGKPDTRGLRGHAALGQGIDQGNAFRAASESPRLHSATPISTRSLSRNWPGSADNTGIPPAWLATTPGVVNKKLSVPMNSTTARALPAADARGHTGRSAMRSAATISIVPRPRATVVTLNTS